MAKQVCGRTGKKLILCELRKLCSYTKIPARERGFWVLTSIYLQGVKSVGIGSGLSGHIMFLASTRLVL
jgi:hypothetical protein